MKKLEATVQQSTTCWTDLTLKDRSGSGSGLKRGLRLEGFSRGDEVVIILQKDFDLLIDKK